MAALEVTTLHDGRQLVVARPATGALKGVVLLIPGGNTKLKLGPGGETRSENFVIRSRDLLLTAGFATAYMDDPVDLDEAIAHLRELGKPVVVLSTSRGTIVAASNAVRLGKDGPDLLILTSPVTVGENTLGDMDVSALKIPTLVTANTNDTCRFSPPTGAAALATRIGSNAAFVEFSSSQREGDPCKPLSPHGYLGIEDDVIAKIVSWIVARTQ
jgi:hypothetical protein